LFEICNDLILAQSMPSGAVHPNTFGTSRFDHLRFLFEQPSPAPTERQQTRTEREAARAQSRADMAYGRRTFLEQQARQAEENDPEAQRVAFHKAQALKIVNAGLRARGMPLRRDGGDDAPNPPNKGKKKVTKKKIEDQSDDENGEDQPGNETEAAYWRRVNANANSIIQAASAAEARYEGVRDRRHGGSSGF
jgi:hypothetical protein